MRAYGQCAEICLRIGTTINVVVLNDNIMIGSVFGAPQYTSGYLVTALIVYIKGP